MNENLTDEELQAVLGYSHDDPPPAVGQIVTVMVHARRDRSGGWQIDVPGLLSDWYLPGLVAVGWRPVWAGSVNGIEMHREAALAAQVAGVEE